MIKDPLSELLLQLHGSIGGLAFALLSVVFALFLSLVLIPITTDAMVNASAGLAGKHLGRKYRTLFINCSTNNPEMFSMAVAFVFGKLGGIANPLGSNFANIYLMFLVASAWVVAKWWVTGQRDKLDAFGTLVKKEKGIVAWHLIMSFIMFGLSSVAFYYLSGSWQFSAGPDNPPEPGYGALALCGGLCLAGVFIYLFFDRRLHKRRPELYEDIDEDEHTESWFTFAWGTTGLIACCYMMNSLFLACSELYRGPLSAVFGAAIFAGLHYFVGALVTSLPEMNVAIKNYGRITSADLNTGMASASASNMTNLALGAIGCLIAIALMAIGANLTLVETVAP